ncbi:MAG TPA: DUF499 domain-containing protein [Terriglobales bacterium]|nr:DUF499 domain-containing protein [Terriglobales bacterium]HVA69745.1 DUF499 domain-containing protein [Acidimicrobiales bacterium]
MSHKAAPAPAPTNYTPWSQVVQLRPELLSGELSLSMFAADLYDVAMGTGPLAYRDPAEFFALTFPTHNLRDLARDVAARLAGQSDKAVRLLARTYGGGKTHTLITLYHLFNQPGALPDLPAVAEFRQHIGIAFPQARIAALTFDKLDAEKGMETRSPTGELRWLKNPWSVLAFQLAGPAGLASLHADNLPEERDSPPAENLLAKLLSRPAKDGPATLILMDEVLMFARTKVGLDPQWLGRLQAFFQSLTQAAVKTPGCALVASLLATDRSKSDELGRQISQALATIFAREREPEVQPVELHDVAEVLRRRLFTPESIRDKTKFRASVAAAINGIRNLDDATAKDPAGAERSFEASFPFHPALIEIFHAKWTQLASFQLTRGVLRCFAMALRNAASWDACPVAGAGVFLNRPGDAPLSEAARELCTLAGGDGTEGREANWHAIVEGELDKARKVQAAFPSLHHRELEQAVVAVFLHSLPAGQRATTRDLLSLLGPTSPDAIEIFKALRQWVNVSWFLDEEVASDALGESQLPKAWRLGFRPNLRQMHHTAQEHVSPSAINHRLDDEIGKLRLLDEGARQLGARVHKLPAKPSDVSDDADFHYVILGPAAASAPGRPSDLAKAFINQTTSADNPRNLRNNLVIAAPAADALESARQEIRAYLAWEEVRVLLRAEQPQLEPAREALLASHLDAARKRIPAAIEQAYSIFVTLSKDNKIEAHRLQPAQGPLFARIQADTRSRIVAGAVSAPALLPGGPYDLWAEGQSFRRVTDLAEAFAQNPKLPKILGAGVIRETMIEGCDRGEIALRLPRPDQSGRVFWRQRPDDAALNDPALEVVLPKAARLTQIPTKILAPGHLPALWPAPAAAITLADLLAFFSGAHLAELRHDGFAEYIPIPGADPAVVEAAVQAAVVQGILWFTYGPTSLLCEEIPLGLLTPAAVLRPPPAPVPSTAILPDAIPSAWKDGKTTAAALAATLGQATGQILPWAVIRDAIDGALRAHLLVLAPGSPAWPAASSAAAAVVLTTPSGDAVPGQPFLTHAVPPPTGTLIADAPFQANQIQDLADHISEIVKLGANHKVRFRVRVELQGEPQPERELVDRLNTLLVSIAPGFKLQ